MVSAKHAVRVAFAFGLQSLLYEVPLDWSEEERQYPRKLLHGEKIPGRVRLIQDRFARVCSELRLTHAEIDESRQFIFSDWVDWNSVREGNVG